MPGTTRKASTSTLSCASQARSKTFRCARSKTFRCARRQATTGPTPVIEGSRTQKLRSRTSLQLRFETLGGVGIVSPEKAILQDQNQVFRQAHQGGTKGCQPTEKEEEEEEEEVGTARVP